MALAAPALRAQVAETRHHHPTPPLLALSVSNLTFGTVLPGIPSRVTVRDERHAGAFEVQGPDGATVRLEFILPAALDGERGAQLPISFGHGDGWVDFSHGYPRRGHYFDPHGPVIATLGPNGRLLVRLGGTVSPARLQAGGSYVATIAITVYSLGN
jgi:hypothetical protein